MLWTAFGFTAATLGAMLFFGAVVAPTAFTRLSEKDAGIFVRALFPRYYLAFAITSLAAMIFAFAAGRGWAGIVLVATALGFIVARQVLMPMINAAKDSGEMAKFDRLHKGSVYLNFVQIITLAVALWLLASSVTTGL